MTQHTWRSENSFLGIDFLFQYVGLRNRPQVVGLAVSIFAHWTILPAHLWYSKLDLGIEGFKYSHTSLTDLQSLQVLGKCSVCTKLSDPWIPSPSQQGTNSSQGRVLKTLTWAKRPWHFPKYSNEVGRYYQILLNFYIKLWAESSCSIMCTSSEDHMSSNITNTDFYILMHRIWPNFHFVLL